MSRGYFVWGVRKEVGFSSSVFNLWAEQGSSLRSTVQVIFVFLGIFQRIITNLFSYFFSEFTAELVQIFNKLKVHRMVNTITIKTWVVLTCALRAHVKKPKRRNIL